MKRQGLSGLTVPATDLVSGGSALAEPITFIDGDSLSPDFDLLSLPPWPVIATGKRHETLVKLDTFVEAGFDVRQIRKAVEARPIAAATLVQLLRLLPSLSLEDGLVAESLAYAALQGSSEHREWQAGRVRAADRRAPGAVLLTREGDAVTVTLDRPDAGNAIDRPMRDALHEAFALANLDTTITSVTLRGTGRCFSLGADLDEFGTTLDPATAHAIRRRTLPPTRRCAALIASWRRSTVPA